MTYAELNRGLQLFLLPTLGQGQDATVPALLEHEQLCWGGCGEGPTTPQTPALDSGARAGSEN